jgi:hypothetical protein
MYRKTHLRLHCGRITGRVGFACQVAGLLLACQTSSTAFAADLPAPRWIRLDEATLQDTQTGLQWTVHGVTKPVALLAKINKVTQEPGESPRTGFDADGDLRRSDFGLGRYVPMIADEIAIHITLEAHTG